MVFVEVTYFDFFVVKIYAISTHSYTLWRKKLKNIFIIILVYVQWLYIVALCLLIWLKATKNVYSHNDNNVWCFFYKNLLVWKEITRIFSDLWVYFYGWLKMWLFFSMKRSHVNVVGTGKNMWELYVWFFKNFKIASQIAPGDSKTHYFPGLDKLCMQNHEFFKLTYLNIFS